jgi:small subunit ribosomal protein S1
MAEAKTTAKAGTTAKVSKRKAGTSKKTTKLKTKKVKATAVDTAAKTRTAEVKAVEKVVTTRHRRMMEKAQVRATMPSIPAPVDEVRAVKITDVAGVVYDAADYNSMVDMYESTIKAIKEGVIVPGSVMGVTRDDVIVDVGFKSEGVIPISEFPKPLNIKVGDEIEVYLDKMEDANGQLALSKQKADFMRVWDNIRDIHDSGEPVEGRVMRRIKGGLVVDVMGVDAFLPGSQVALRQVPDFDALISTTMSVKIIKLNKSRRNIVVSRRVVLEEQRDVMRTQLLQEIEIGQVRQGGVKNITDFGVFIDLGGVDGLLHITDMSWGRIRHPSEVVSLGDNIDVKILDFDDRTSRISLGLKQLTPYPWDNIEQKFPVDSKITGRVVSITDYGAFVELEKGIEGLIHISEMSWTQHIKHPSKIMSVNDVVEAVVLSVDKENEKISLGIKQMDPDPWQIIGDKYPIGKVVSGKVRNLTAFGAFVELEEGIDGLVHISDMSWTKRIQHPSEVMKKGDELEVKIIRIDHDNRRISLGFKQLSEDPWAELAGKHAVGSECLGVISKVMDRGVLVSLDDDVEGFVPVTQLTDGNLKDPTEMFNEGEEIPLRVIEFDRNLHKIVLSVTAYYKDKDKQEMDEFMGKHSAKATSALADAMPEELKTEAKAEAAETSATDEPQVAEESSEPETQSADDAPATEESDETAEEKPKTAEPPSSDEASSSDDDIL